MRFKYIRSLEALFESTPQSVLQLVYLMRSGELGEVFNTDSNSIGEIWTSAIFIISIIQSIVSMTNAMLNSDAMYMNRSKFKKYRKRLPPSKEFLKHFLLRLCEITYRIFLFSLFWTVVGGLGFGILLLYECCLVIFWLHAEYSDSDPQLATGTFDWQTVFLGLNQLIVLPPELMFEMDSFVFMMDPDSYERGCRDLQCISLSCLLWVGYLFSCSVCGCAAIPPYFKDCKNYITSRKYNPHYDHENGLSTVNNEIFKYGSPRIGLSLFEFIVIVIFGVIDANSNDPDQVNYLFSLNHCLIFFIVSTIAFCIYTHFDSLMPDIRLPGEMALRSPFAYAFLGEISELERMREVMSKKTIKRWNIDLDVVNIEQMHRFESMSARDVDLFLQEPNEPLLPSHPHLNEFKSLQLKQDCTHFVYMVSYGMFTPLYRSDDLFHAIIHLRVGTAKKPRPFMQRIKALQEKYFLRRPATFRNFGDESKLANAIKEYLQLLPQQYEMERKHQEKRDTRLDLGGDEIKLDDIDRSWQKDEIVDLRNFIEKYINEDAGATRINSVAKEMWDTFCNEYHNFIDETKCCVMYALANEQYQTVRWFEQQGCNDHKWLWQCNNRGFNKVDHHWARSILMEKIPLQEYDSKA